MERYPSRPALVGLIDEVSRLHGRLKTVFGGSRLPGGLGDSEMLILSAVVESARAPTVPQIGRSLGHPRQLVQRAANALIARDLITTSPNPDHKRAVLLMPTDQGRAIKAEADRLADTYAAELSGGMDEDAILSTSRALGQVRRQLEAFLRERRS